MCFDHRLGYAIWETFKTRFKTQSLHEFKQKRSVAIILNSQRLGENMLDNSLFNKVELFLGIFELSLLS